MKDVPPPYVPPHHRLRSVITPPTSVNNNNTLKNPSHTSINPYPYIPPPHQQQQQQLPMPNRGIELPTRPGIFTSDIDSWKWRLTTLLHSNDKQELISREKKDRRDYEQIAELATSMGLHSHLYTKVLVVSKVPLPNYRFDLDDKRPQREVSLPPGLQRRVDAHLREYQSHKAEFMNGSQNSLFSKTSSNGSNAVDESLFELPELPPQSQVALEKVLSRRSLQLQNEQQAWQDSSEGWRMIQLRLSLPAYKERDAILNAISHNQVVIISGETGCGKTTQIPQFILESEIDALRGATCSIICTQPRRISAMSVSERIATERGEKLGETVGYKVRLEGIKGRDTRLLFCTTGILLRRSLVDRRDIRLLFCTT